MRKNVSGMLSTPVITANQGPSSGGTAATIPFAIADTIPVPESTPTSTAAANTMATTVTIDVACDLMLASCSSGFGKFTTSAMAVAPMNTRESGSTSRPSRVSRATVSPRLNQISLGRSVARFGSRLETRSFDGALGAVVVRAEAHRPATAACAHRHLRHRRGDVRSVRPEASRRLRSERPSR